MSIDLLTLDDDEAQEIFAISQAMGVIGDLFVQREGTPEALSMAVAQLRTVADVLERVGARWQAEIAG